MARRERRIDSSTKTPTCVVCGAWPALFRPEPKVAYCNLCRPKHPWEPK